MSGQRQEYFLDLLKDCKEVCAQQNIDADDQAYVIAALILSDGFNGIRKALLTSSHIASRRDSHY